MEWVSVETRLPESGTDILAYFDDGYMTRVTYSEDFELWADSGNVTHWMQLPPTPKEG